MKNNFIGGMSSKLTPFDVAKKWKISPVEFIPILEKGTEHEMEHTDDKDIARRIALDHIVERLDYYDQLDKIEKMKKGAVLEKPEIFNDITLYYEKKGNWLFDKGNFYAWLYDEKGAGAKLEKQEYDFIMFPPMGKGNPFSDKYVPPLKMIWDKTYQKKFKGINHLLGIVKGFYDEDKNQIIIEMMTTNPKFRRQGINAHIIKNLREVFEVSQDDVIFDKPTKEGKLFESSKKYENGGLIAPNGEQSNLTPELYQVVRTKAFKNWFGDWENDPENASKVLDKNGEPKIVYHGTNNDFTIFDKNKLGEKNFFAESASLGFFFAGNIKTSEAYIGMNSMDWAGVQFGAYDDIINKYKPELDSINKDIEQIYEKYRKQEKDNIKKLQDEIIEKIRETYKDFSENDSKGIFLRDINWEEINRLAQEENNLNGNTQKLKELNDKIKLEIEAKWKVKTNANPRIISLFLNIRNPYIIDYANNKQTDLSQDIKTAIKNTNDGVIFNNLNDGDGVDDIFVVFDSEQIKLADGTNTTFDRNNPDIRFAKGGDTNRNFNDKELLKRYNDGESIGFTAIAHLKAQGLIKRSDGTKRKSKGIFEQGGLIAPNGEQSNLTSEQWDLVRTPEFKGWFGFWDLYPSGKANDYYEPSVRTIAKELKQEKASAIKEVVDFLSKQVTEEDVLIPMPSRYGFATDTQKLAEKISEKTGAKVFDCLVGKKRESIYELKKTNQDVSDFEFDFQINCEIPKARNYFIVDNVIGTGVTMKNALTNVIARVGNNVSPLVYAIDLNNISKVVDENGEPLVVHHGSIIDTKFDIFDYKKADLGFHFGTKEQAKKRVESKSVLPPRKSIVNSFFLNIKVLFEMTDVGEWQYPQRYIDELMSDNIIEEKVAKQKGFLSLYRREDNAIIRDYIKSKYGSFVGFVYNNKYEGNGKSFIALSPEQIKLADGTNTTFDENNPDIRFAKGGLIAPNGNESNLTPEQYKLGRTKAFKDWFGDWENDPENSSKVVDENGEPLVVWHNSRTLKHQVDKFYIFNVDKQLGSHFGTLKQSQSLTKSDKELVIVNEELIDFRYYQVFLNIKNPIRLKDVGVFQLDTLINAIGEENLEDNDWFYINKYNEKSKDTNVDRAKYIAKSKFGYDGAVYLNRYESDAKTSLIISLDEVSDKKFKIKVPSADDSWIAFEPNQIKLADGTNTTFDGRNPDIRFAKGGLIAPNGNESNLTPEQYKLVRTKAFKDWFGDWENDPKNSSKVVDENGEPLVCYHGSSKIFNEFEPKFLNAYSPKPETHFINYRDYAEGFGNNIYECFLDIKTPEYIYKNGEKKPYSEESDGTIILNFLDSKYKELQKANRYAVFSSYQIKLADGTNTTFDSNNADIRFAEGGVIDFLSSKSVAIRIDNDIYKIQYQKDEIGNSEKNVWFAKVISKNGEQVQGRLCYADDYLAVIFGFNLDEVSDEIMHYYQSNDLYLILQDEVGKVIEKRHIENNENRFAKGGLIAPNGNESNLTPEQYKLVRSEAFKDWFGDWENDPENSSKVVDENGEPLLVYHGTKYNFNIFEMADRIQSFYVRDYGAYFTDNLETAKIYSLDFDEKTNQSKLIEEQYQKALNQWLNSNSEKDLIELRKLSKERVQVSNNLISSFVSKNILNCFLNIRNPLIYDGMRKEWFKVFKGKMDLALENNNDGAIIKNVKEVQDINQNTFIVFAPNQIKLADGSNTTFDSGNPDIRFNKGGEIENLIDQGEIELKVYPTTPEHANVYGLKSENPLYIESIFISENQRLKGIGKKVLEYLNDFAIKNGHDVMFGHITQKASFSKDDSRQSDLDDVDMIKYWLQSNGYETCEGNNDFYKVMNKPNIIFEDGGVNLSNKELMANDFLNEQKELQRNSKYAIFLDTNYSNYTNEKRELLKNLTDELIKKLGYNPLINYYLTSDKVILMFDDDSNLIGALEFTIQPKYTHVPRYSPDYIKPEPIFENNDNVFYIEYIFSFSKGNGQKMMNRIKKYADQYNVDIGLEGSIIEGTDGKPIASAKHLRRFYDKQGFINVKGHYFLYTPNSMEKGGEVTTENKIYEITRHYFGSLNASSMGGYFNVEGVSLRIKNHLANWNNFYEYHLKNIDENSNPYFLSVVIGSDNSYREQDKADINTEEFVNDHIEENTNLKAEEIVFDYSDTIEDIIYTIDKKMKKMTSMAKGGKTISQTPAPASDRVSGSKTNPKGSASDTSLARSIKFNDSLLKAIENKVKAHNEEYPSKKVTTPTAKAVVRRGMGAYSKSHRPFITGGAPNSRQAWGLARLNKFLLKKRGVKVKSAYIQDDDLL